MSGHERSGVCRGGAGRLNDVLPPHQPLADAYWPSGAVVVTPTLGGANWIMPCEHVHFVTGRLAEHSLRGVLAELAPRAGFDYSVDVLGISVAALMTTPWVAARIRPPPQTTRIVLPGYCQGDLDVVRQAAHVSVERGPRDLRLLPEYFGQTRGPQELEHYAIEILAEINHAPRREMAELAEQARRLAADGADVIDLGCDPAARWQRVGDAVRMLRDLGLRVSIDTMDPHEVEAAVAAGAELVLSVNSSNVERAADWQVEVVAIPDTPDDLDSLDRTVAQLAERGVPLRIDPLLEPIGIGFARSLERFLDVRRRYPQAEMMMGIGNVTELTDADSAPINVLLLGFCEELSIRSVLTTQEINWARTSVRECDLARRLVHCAVGQQTIPKHLEPRLVMLRDPEVLPYEAGYFDRLAADLKDANYRLFADGGQIHLVAAGLHLTSEDPFELFDALLATQPRNLDPGHAFYLGYEMAKAVTALTLFKEYRQDEALDWGLLTRPEAWHRLRRQRPASAAEAAIDQPPGEVGGRP
jgi:dihydropteroate synthase